MSVVPGEMIANFAIWEWQLLREFGQLIGMPGSEPDPPVQEGRRYVPDRELLDREVWTIAGSGSVWHG